MRFYDITEYSRKTYLGYIPHVSDFKIYKVIENNPTKQVEDKNNNLMLFHSTTRKCAVGILLNGFRKSKSEWFGKGQWLYITSCTEVHQSVDF